LYILTAARRAARAAISTSQKAVDLVSVGRAYLKQGENMLVGRKVFAAIAGLSLALTAGAVRAGTIGTIGDQTDPAHDLFVGLYDSSTFTPGPSGAFDFEGMSIPDGLQFTLRGTFDTTAETVTSTAFTASGTDSSGTFVTYSGSVSVMDLSDFLSAGKIYFSIDSNDLPLQQAFVLVDFVGKEADISPTPPVPAPAAAKAGLALMGVVGLGVIRRRRLA
jgi:MYXO-CTERM domain-containing protein